MPELPEVEFGRRLAERALVGRRLVSVSCADDDIVFDGVTPEAVRDALLGARVERVERRGKHLWWVLDRPLHPLFHFGMTGAFRLRGERPLELEASPREPDMDWPPRFTRIHVTTDEGVELVMTNARRLGRIRLRRDPPNEPPISELGFDPLHALPGPEALAGLLAGRRGTLKGLLLDQGFAAGVGNWIADEVLYQARLDPRRAAGSLDAEACRRLHAALDAVIRHAVSVDADKARFPESWLFHHRWGRTEGARTADGEAIEFLRVGGRTTAWVPSRQAGDAPGSRRRRRT